MRSVKCLPSKRNFSNDLFISIDERAILGFFACRMKHNQLSNTVGLALLAGIALSTAAFGATTMAYTVTGGSISGTLNGVQFENAAWTMTATADSAGVLLYLLNGVEPMYCMPVSPTLTIDDGVSTPLIVNMLNLTVPSLTWAVVSVDQSDPDPANASGMLWLSDDLNDGFGPVIFAEGPYFDLTSPISEQGQGMFIPGRYLTDAGLLEITNFSGLGTFTATAVPETSTILPTMALIAGGLMIRRRSNRRH